MVFGFSGRFGCVVGLGFGCVVGLGFGWVYALGCGRCFCGIARFGLVLVSVDFVLLAFIAYGFGF